MSSRGTPHGSGDSRGADCSLGKHAEIPIAFLVDKILEVSVSDGGLGGIILQESASTFRTSKDYDAIKGEGPTRWPKRFDVTNWGLIAVFQSGMRVGGAVVAFKTPNLEMLGDQNGVAALWDIRIRPNCGTQGIGSSFFAPSGNWRACASSLRSESKRRM